MEIQKQRSGGRGPGGIESEGSGGSEGESELRSVARRGLAKRRADRLKQRDRYLVALLGICRYLTASQLVQLGGGARTEKAAAYRLRGLAGEATRAKVRPFEPALLRVLPFRRFDGGPFEVWALTHAGYAVAGAELGRLLRVPRADVGASFAEHSAFLTDLFVQLVGPFLQAGLRPSDFPFRWDVAEDVELPWREKEASGLEKSRVIRPDAVLEVPAARRRFFIECETGTHTLQPISLEKAQSTVRKVERYDAYVSAKHAGASHYQRKYPDGWPCEVLFLVRKESRRRSTAEVLSRAKTHRGTRIAARALTLGEAVDYFIQMLPRPEEVTQTALPSIHYAGAKPFYGESDHRAVNEFVVDMTGALSAANGSLRRNGLLAVAEPASKAGMLEFLRRAQAEMQRQRNAEVRHG